MSEETKNEETEAKASTEEKNQGGAMQMRTPISFAVFIILCGLAFLALKNRDAVPDDEAGEEARESIPELEGDAIQALEITREGITIRLEREGESWKVTQPLAADSDMTAVGGALDKLEGLEVANVAATNATNHERLGVVGDEAIRVAVHGADGVLLDGYFGNVGGGNTMFRLEGQDAVLALRGSLRYAFNRPLKDWRDRRVVDVNPEHVREMTLAYGDTTRRFVRGEDNAWAQAEGEATIERFSPAKVNSLASAFARLRAHDFGAEDLAEAAAGFGEPAVPAEGEEAPEDNRATVTLVVETPGEGEGAEPTRETVTLRLGGSPEGTTHRYVRREGVDLTYVLAPYAAGRFSPSEADLQEPEPGSEPPAPTMMPGGPGGLPPGIPPELLRQLQAGMMPH